MRSTPNYNLPIFEENDNFYREDFNRITETLDSAVGDVQQTINEGVAGVLEGFEEVIEQEVAGLESRYSTRLTGAEGTISAMQPKVNKIDNLEAQVNTLPAMQTEVNKIAAIQTEVDKIAGIEDDIEALQGGDTKVLEFSVNVKDYGAVGDGVTNDTSAILAAIASGRNVIFEKGKTYVVHNLEIRSNSLVLNGNGATLKALNSTSSCLKIPKTSSNIKIKDLSFIGFADGTLDTPAGINIYADSVNTARNAGAKNIEITGCRFLGAFVFSIIATGVTGLKIRDCYGTNNKYIASVSAGGYFILTQTCYDVDIANNEAKATFTDRHAVYISGVMNENVTIRNNKFDWSEVGNTTGHEICVTSRSTNKLRIHDNFIKGGYGGLALNASSGDITDVHIHSNTIIDVKNHSNQAACISLVVSDTQTQGTMRNVKIYNNILSALTSNVFGIAVSFAERFDVCNNIITNLGNSAMGIQVYNSSYGIIKDNTISGNGTSPNALYYAGSVTHLEVGSNKITGFTRREFSEATTLQNITHDYARTFVVSVSSGVATISGDNDNIFESYAGQVYGCDIRLRRIATAGYAVFANPAFGADRILIRDVDVSTNTVKLNVSSNNVAVNGASASYSFVIALLN